MKLRLVLKTKTKKGKDVSIKFNIAPSKHIGFINFINIALNQELPINLSFEKVSKSGEREESKIGGVFKFQGKDTLALSQLNDEVKQEQRKRVKQHQKRSSR